DVEAVFSVVEAAVERCRGGRGPALVEAETYRWHGHYEGDAQPYKPEDEASGWRDRDPLGIAAARLDGAGQETEQGLAELQEEMRAVVEAAVEFARAPIPRAPKRRTSMSTGTEPVRYLDAINAGIADPTG